LKMKWRMLQKISSYTPRKQSQIISACCALQNFIRLSGIRDRHFVRCDHDENYVPRELLTINLTPTQCLAVMIRTSWINFVTTLRTLCLIVIENSAVYDNIYVYCLRIPVRLYVDNIIWMN
jgi:hypothetical protein